MGRLNQIACHLLNKRIFFNAFDIGKESDRNAFCSRQVTAIHNDLVKAHDLLGFVLEIYYFSASHTDILVAHIQLPMLISAKVKLDRCRTLEPERDNLAPDIVNTPVMYQIEPTHVN